MWPNGVLPQAGDSVYLDGNWTVLLDIDPPPLDDFIIDGTLFVDDTRNVVLEANWIHIRAGNLTVGSANKPFVHNFTLKINGKKFDFGEVVDPFLAGNKMMVVTGILNLYGISPETTISFLTKTAERNSSIIWVN